MAWSSLLSNQMVSYTDAQGGGFTLQSGQSNVTSNQCMTKSDALAKYNLDASAMTAYASNQLVPKSVWVSGLAYVQYSRTSGYLTSILACMQYDNWVNIVYKKISTGQFFTNSALTTVFNGNNYWYLFYDSTSSNPAANFKIDNSGYIANTYDCGF